MIRFLNIFFGTLVVLGFSQCGSSKQLIKDPPFSVKEASIEAWTAGENKKVKGENIYLTFSTEDLKGNISFDSLYYKGQMAPLEHYKKGDIYIGRFSDDDIKFSDLIMHADPKMEFGNMPPKATVKPPFEIEEEQVLLCYTYNDEKQFYVINEFEVVVPIHYKESPIIKK